MARLFPSFATSAVMLGLAGIALAQEATPGGCLNPSAPGSGGIAGAPGIAYQATVRGGCVSGSTCITAHPVHGPDGGTITFPPTPADALPIFGYLYFQYITTTDCTVDRIGDFANATVNGVNINTLPFVEQDCLNATPCFPGQFTHFYRVDVSTLFEECDLNVAVFELRNFGMTNDTNNDWVEGATLMVAYCSPSSPATEIILLEDAQVKGFGADATDPLTYTWSGFNADGVSASLVLGVGNGQTFTEAVRFSTTTTPPTMLGADTGGDGLFDGTLCPPGPFGNGGLYDNTIIDVSALVNPGDTSATFTIGGGDDCLTSNPAFLCLTSTDAPSDCVPAACIASTTGACCLPNGSCIEVTQPDCAAAGGTYQGDNTLCLVVVCPLPIPQDRVSATEKGSVLIYSKVELRWTAAGALIQDTFIDIANDFPADVLVKMYFVNGDPRILGPGGVVIEPGWNWVNNLIELTANEPTYWSAATGLPKGVSPFGVLDPGALPGRPDPEVPGERMLRGFIVAFAVNAAGCEIRWNHLKGDACIVNYAESSAWEYNAWSFQAGVVENGLPLPDCGTLAFNGLEYAPAFDMLLLDFYAVGSAALSGPASMVTVNTDLTLHPLSADLRQETAGPVRTKASFDIWNMNEVKFSGVDRCITCWDQTLLSNYGLPNHFLLVNLQTDKGRARINDIASAVVCPPSAALGLPAPTVDPLLGLATKHLTFDGVAFERAGTNLHGLGTQTDGVIRFDPNGPPPSESGGVNWLNVIGAEMYRATQSRRR